MKGFCSPSGACSPQAPSPLSVEQRLWRLEGMMGIYNSPEGVESFLNSEMGRQEYRAALRDMVVKRDKKSLEDFLKKTGGRVPRREG